MKIAPFETEQFFARYEFSTQWQLCNSDCESMSINELLLLAGSSLEEFGQQRLMYTDSQGHPDLRESIASIYSSVKADDVIVMGTPVEGIYLAARSLLEPGDEVIVLSPAYDALINLFEHIAGPEHVKKWQFKAGEPNWTLDLDELNSLVSARSKLLVINFPHNPTGFLPSAAMLQELVSFAEQKGLILFCDEMYFGLVHSATEAIPSAADVSRNAIVLSGLSKAHGLPGLRCGWLIVKDEAIRQDIMNWKYYTSICPAVPTEFLSIAALRVWETLRDQNIARIERNLEVADAFFARWPELFTWRRPQAGSTALVGFDVPSVEALASELAASEGILIQSAKMLGGDDQHMRIGLGRDSFPKTLGKFEEWLQRSERFG